MLATQIKLIICGINDWIAWENKFFKALTSPTTLASIFPTGLLSKKSKDKYWIWLYNSCLILTKILLVMLVIIFHLILDNTQAIKFNDINEPPIIIKPLTFLLATKLSIAIFNNNGLTISHIITKSINKTTIRELALYGLR